MSKKTTKSKPAKPVQPGAAALPGLDHGRTAALAKLKNEPAQDEKSQVQSGGGDGGQTPAGVALQPADKPAAEGKKAPKTPATPKTPKAAKSPKADKPKRLSAIDAAAKVLAETKEPMRATDLIAAMAKRGLWTSPGGKTPEATLYAAIIREITAKGKDSRFKKHDRGVFVATTHAKGG